jgi:hypothetical protein
MTPPLYIESKADADAHRVAVTLAENRFML